MKKLKREEEWLLTIESTKEEEKPTVEET